MQHIEFIHREHFEERYFRVKPTKALSGFIDFFWEIDFESLWKVYPDGFSDALFPNVGYTYMINLGTPFVMQLEAEKHKVSTDAFLPRHKSMICHHSPGNKIFGIKFRVSPVMFEKKINFSEYREYIFPLAYLIDREIVNGIKKAANFEKRVNAISGYYEDMIDKYAGSMHPVEVVTAILKHCTDKSDFNTPVEAFADQYGISSRTLQRYFTATTSISSKQALQILRIRKAVEDLTTDPSKFDWNQYGYFDYSHFRKHLKAFLGEREKMVLDSVRSEI